MRNRILHSIARRLAVCSMLVVAMLAAPLQAADPAGVSDGDMQRVVGTSDTAVVRLTAEGTQISKSDLIAELAGVAGLDLSPVQWLLPKGKLDLEKPKTAKRIARINRWVGRYAGARIERDSDGDRQLVVEIHRAQMHRDKRRARSKVRQASLRVLDPRGALRSERRYGLAIDGAAKQRPEARLIVGVHGFNGSATAIEAFLNPLRDAGFVCASLVYPNDQPIADSARLLSDELKALARREPKRRVALVTFSMGGLVARATIEDASLDPGNVERLVMIAPPNHGSVCARFARGADLYEHIVRERRFAPRGMIAASLCDGLGEARQDLCPSSRFLRKLNARPRNDNVRYSILLGEGGELGEEQVERMISLLDKLEEKSTLVSIFGPKLDRLRAELAELSDPSDGFVTVERGRLGGVDDIQTLPFGHADRFADLHAKHVVALHRAIAKRLK